MKYYKRSRFPRFIGSTGFIALIACALIAVGAIVWLAVSNRRAEERKPETEQSEKMPSYDEPTPSYNSSADELPPSDENEAEHMTDVNNSESSIPFEEETPSETEEAESKPEPEKRSFVLPADGSISKDYSDTALQYSATFGDMRLHTGIDIACALGSDIKAAGQGIVTSVEESATLGKTVTIDHGDKITVKYCGFDSVSVKQGDKVSAGHLLGTSGSVPSECADQSHIHIEVLFDGKPASPLKILGLE